MPITARWASALLALCLLACRLHGSLAQGIAITTPSDFLEANSDEYQCMWALLERSGLAEALALPQLANTYFLPSDAAFITDLADTVAEGSTDPTAGADLTVEQVVAMIDSMPEEAAVQFVKAHVSPANYPSVSALAYPGGVPAAALDPFGEGDVPPRQIIKNSLSQDVAVVYEDAFHALHLDIASEDGGLPSSAYVAGPAAIPAGESTIYILLNVLGDPYLITDSAVQALAVNGTLVATAAVLLPVTNPFAIA